MSNRPKNYKYCIVPRCTSTSIKTPNKYFFDVPRQQELRNKWCQMMRRDEKVPLSAKSVQHCCEDHFDLETEVENFMRYKLVGGNMKLMSGILPSKFACQHSSKPDNPRPAFEKRQRKKLLEASTSFLRKPVPVQEEYDPLYISEAENITKNKGVQVSKHLKKVDQTCQTKKIKVTSIKPIPSYKEDGAGSKESQESATDSSHPCSSDSSDLGDVQDYKQVWIKTEKDDGSYDYQNVSIKTEPCARDESCYKDVSLQTDVFAKDDVKYNDVSVQTYIFARNKSTQTLAALSANTATEQKLRKEIEALKRAATPSTSSVKKQKCQTQPESGIAIEDIHKYLEQNYSEQSYKLLKMQLDLLNKSPKGCRYTNTFKKFALSISFLGPKVYKQFSAFYRLPSITTLKRYTRNWMINPGFNDFIFGLLELRAKMFNEKERDCIVCLDEIALKPHLFYNISNDKIVGFEEGEHQNTTKIATKALVVMARGITSIWKQPIAYFFYNSAAPSKEIKDILFESIRKLTAIGYNVNGVVSDQAPNFRKLVKTVLKLTPEKTYFFVDNVRLVYLFDVLHLLESTTNNFISHDFRLPEGTAKKSYLDTFHAHDKKKEYRLCPELTNEHLCPGKFKKIKVKFASQIFSYSVAAALETYIGFEVLPPEASVTAKFVKTINDLLDLLNCCHSNNSNAFMGTEKQLKFLEDIATMFDDLKVIDMVKEDGQDCVEKCVNDQMHFIYGWKLTINSIKTLWESLKSRRYTFLVTSNLNVDCMELFFGQIRHSCGKARKPTPIQFSRAFKKVFTLKYFNQVDGANGIDNIAEALLNITPELLETCKTIPEPIARSPLQVFTSDYRNISYTDSNGLVYITDYLLTKSLSQHTCALCLSYIEHCTSQNEATVLLSSGFYNAFQQFEGLAASPPSILEFMIHLENYFVENFDKIGGQKFIGKKLKDLFRNVPFTHPCKNFPYDYFLSLYIRLRIYLTIKVANSAIKDQIRQKVSSNIKLTALKNI